MTTPSNGLRNQVVGLFAVAVPLLTGLATAARAQVPPAFAQCKNVVANADNNCAACASINNSSPTLNCTQFPPCPYQGTGTHVVTLTCTDQNGLPAGSCIGTVTVVDNTPPQIVCPPDQSLMCGAPSNVTATSTDNCGASLTTCSPQSANNGVITESCTAQDASGNTSSCSFTISEAPPTVTVTNKPSGPELWPPNHKYYPVTLRDCVASVVSSCAGPLDIMQYGVITRVESDEFEDDKLYTKGLGDGHTCRDIEIVGSATVLLRAERDGKGDGREYTIYFTVGSPQGGSTPGTCTVRVPHDQSGRMGVRQACHYCEGEGCAGCLPHNPMCNY